MSKVFFCYVSLIRLNNFLVVCVIPIMIMHWLSSLFKWYIQVRILIKHQKDGLVLDYEVISAQLGWAWNRRWAPSFSSASDYSSFSITYAGGWTHKARNHSKVLRKGVLHLISRSWRIWEVYIKAFGGGFIGNIWQSWLKQMHLYDVPWNWCSLLPYYFSCLHHPGNRFSLELLSSIDLCVNWSIYYINWVVGVCCHLFNVSVQLEHSAGIGNPCWAVEIVKFGKSV